MSMSNLNAIPTMDLCTAIKRGYFALVRFLLDLGENPNHRDLEGKTPLIFCCLIEDTKWGLGLAETLLEKGASVGIRDRFGLNALHYACLYARAQLVNIFLKAVDYNLNTGDRLGHSALFYAVSSGSLNCVHLLVDVMTKYGVPVDKSNKFGITPLMQAYKIKRFDIAEILITEGCADEDLRDNEGKSAREMAEEYKHIFITEQELGIRRARTALRRAKSAPPRSLRKVVEEETEKTPVLPLTPNANRLIRLCKDCDLRNDPVYMFNLTPMDLFISEPLHLQRHKEPSSRPQSAHNGNPRNFGTWRKDFRTLFKHLEVRHTDSYRETLYMPRSVSPSTEGTGDPLDPANLGYGGYALRIPGGDPRLERRGSAMSSKGSMSSIKAVAKIGAKGAQVALRRGSNNASPTQRRPASRQAIPVVREP